MNVKAGDRIPVEVSWLVNGEKPTGAEVRAIVYTDAGARTYWNGSAFTEVDASLSGMAFDAALGSVRGVFVVPEACIGKVLLIEARPTAPATLVPYVDAVEFRVLRHNEDDVYETVALLHEAHETKLTIRRAGT